MWTFLAHHCHCLYCHGRVHCAPKCKHNLQEKTHCWRGQIDTCNVYGSGRKTPFKKRIGRRAKEGQKCQETEKNWRISKRAFKIPVQKVSPKMKKKWRPPTKRHVFDHFFGDILQHSSVCFDKVVFFRKSFENINCRFLRMLFVILYSIGTFYSRFSSEQLFWRPKHLLYWWSCQKAQLMFEMKVICYPCPRVKADLNFNAKW